MSLLSSAFAILAVAGAASAQVDGQYKASYGAPLGVQQAPTGFGDSNLGQIGSANGSELDAVYASSSGGMLNLLFTGNLESNFNKFDVFVDTGVAGQNQLRGDNAGVDFNGLNRMGNDGSGNGLRFDSSFQASRWVSVTGGNSPYAFFANAAILSPGGGGFGDYLGTSDGQSAGVLSGGNNFVGLQAAINNSNVLGVTGSSAAGALTAITGIELSIPLAWLGVGSADGLKVCAFVNGGGHDYLSNQVLGSLPASYGNLGEPRAVDFSQVPGDQFVVVPAPGALSLLGLAGLAAARRRRA